MSNPLAVPLEVNLALARIVQVTERPVSFVLARDVLSDESPVVWVAKLVDESPLCGEGDTPDEAATALLGKVVSRIEEAQTRLEEAQTRLEAEADHHASCLATLAGDE